MLPPNGRVLACLIVATALAAAAPARAQTPPPPDGTFVPQIAQPGKDVVWVPSPNETVELMLDIAGVTPDDYVIDLGSGDGRTVIAAARRGARALGVEYNPDMVALSRQEALRAGVADRARFVEGDMYEADVSGADVLALFLLTENLRKLTPTFLTLPPGTRIVSNTFTIPGWTAERTVDLGGDCTAWCTVLLYLVPAQVDGVWQADGATLQLAQQAQAVGGRLMREGGEQQLEDVRLRGARLTFAVAGATYEVTIDGDAMRGTRRDATGATTPWTATRRPG